MKFNIKSLGYEIMSRLGISVIQRRFFNNFVAIVMYHGVLRSPLRFYDGCFIDEEPFRRQMKYLKKDFEVIRLSELHERIRSRGKSRPFAVITFDDGYQNNYDLAFPILREEKLPATIFLTTGLIGTADTIWSSRLHHALAMTRKTSLEWDALKLDITGQAEKAEALAAIKEKLKKMPFPQMISNVRAIVLSLTGNPDEEIEVGSPYRMLDRNAINAMVGSGLIEFGAHTHSHAILSRLSSLEQEEEIKRSIDAVRELTGSPCRVFAYPNGGQEDYNGDTVRILQTHGITTAVTTMNGYNCDGTPMMELRRYGIGADTGFADFKLIVHHIISVVKKFGRDGAKAAADGY